MARTNQIIDASIHIEHIKHQPLLYDRVRNHHGEPEHRT